MRMRLAPIVMAAVLWPGALPAQSDDPAIVVCEAREGPKPEDSGYQRVAANIRGALVLLTFKASAGGAKLPKEVRRTCRFKLNADGRWELEAPRAERAVAACYALSDQVVSLIQADRMAEANSAEQRMRDCVPILRDALARETFATIAARLVFTGFTYPIDADATRLRP